jgi:hypothetical protein
VKSTHYESVEEDMTAFQGAMTVSAKAWSVYDFVGDTGHMYFGIDPSDGSTMWGEKGFRACADREIDGLVPCLDEVRVGDDNWDEVLALVDWKTGESTSSTKLTDLGVTVGLNPASEVDVHDGSIVLTLPDFTGGGGDYLGTLSGVQVVRVSADGRSARWVASGPGCDYTDFSHPLTGDPASYLQHGVLTNEYGSALSFETGKSVLPGSACAAQAAEGVLYAVSVDGPLPSSVTAPDGTTLAVTGETSGLNFADRLPPVPMKLVNLNLSPSDNDTQMGTGELVGFDPATGGQKWAATVPVTVEIDGKRTISLSLSYDGQRLLLIGDDTMRALNPATGELLWSDTMASGRFAQIERTADGTVVLNDPQSYEGGRPSAYDPETGARLWTADGELVVAPAPDGTENLLQLGGFGEGQTPYLARLVPADRPDRTPVVPVAAPACPSGMSPISWTQYADGAILLCQSGQTFAVVVPAHPDWSASELHFTTGGHEVVFSNGAHLRVVLGGSMVYVDQNATVTGYPASASWSSAAGAVRFTVPAAVHTCPAGSWPISLSTFDGGWLLVCGTGPQQPTSLVYADGTSVSEAGGVTARAGGYCASADVGTVCAYRAPALISVTASDGTTTQHSVDANYFSGHGRGGTGEGTGSYGVNTPDDNAADQVRYLTQILQKSTVGRANLNQAVADVRACRNVAGAIDTIRGVVANREELLEAVDSTPVDAVPNGASLVARLRTALDLSHQSDLVWVQWAQEQLGNGCANGEDSSYYVQLRQMNPDVSVAKNEFVHQWNSTIVPSYDAPRFTRAQI